MIDLCTKYPWVDPSPKPWPDRDWAAMPGMFLDEDNIRSMEPDDLHRDAYTEKDRLEAWRFVNDYHQVSRRRNPGLPPDSGPYLFSADMGEGKSHLMIGFALLAWMFQAVPVFSVQSVGALFGYRITYEEMYDFADVLPPGSILLVDEISALVDGYTGRANRGRTLHAGLTSFRKGGNLMLTATAAEARISWEMKTAYKAVIEPKRYRPTKEVIIGYDTKFRPQTQTYFMREHELEFPDFCYVKAQGLRVPWLGKRVFEDFRQHQAEMAQGRRQIDSKWKLEPVNTPMPYFMDLAAKVYDTLQRVPTSDVYGIDAERMAAQTGKKGNHPATAFLFWLYQNDVLTEFRSSGWIDLKDLLEIAVAHDPKVFTGMNLTYFRDMLHEASGMGDVTIGRKAGITHRRVSLIAIDRFVKGGGKKLRQPKAPKGASK